jgi:hypothetical protein
MSPEHRAVIEAEIGRRLATREVSRALDALVAVKVIGWTWLRHVRHFQPPIGREWWRSLFQPSHGVKPYTSSSGDVENVPAHGDEPIESCNAPNYSTDIAAAWTVIEKMRAVNPFQPAWFEISQLPTGWRANFVGDPHYYAYAETAPLAICLAALRAMGVEGTE